MARTPIKAGVATLLAHIEDWRAAPVWTPESISTATAAWFAHLSPRGQEVRP